MSRGWRLSQAAWYGPKYLSASLSLYAAEWVPIKAVNETVIDKIQKLTMELMRSQNLSVRPTASKSFTAPMSSSHASLNSV
jgi:hypothetical protein